MIETARLVLRPFAAADLDAFVAYRREPREALGALIADLFTARGMHRVLAQADDRNTAVHRLLEHLGLRCEARLVDADWFKGEWTTLRIYAVLEREWAR